LALQSIVKLSRRLYCYSAAATIGSAGNARGAAFKGGNELGAGGCKVGMLSGVTADVFDGTSHAGNYAIQKGGRGRAGQVAARVGEGGVEMARKVPSYLPQATPRSARNSPRIFAV
jgi:hypothetical protein